MTEAAYNYNYNFPNSYDPAPDAILDPSELIMQLIQQYQFESATSSSGGSNSGGSSAHSSPALSKNAQAILNSCPPHLYAAVYAIVDSDEFREEKPLTPEQLCTLLEIEDQPKAQEGKGSRQPLQLFTCLWCPNDSFSTERREKIESHVEGHFNIKPYPCDLWCVSMGAPPDLRHYTDPSP